MADLNSPNQQGQDAAENLAGALDMLLADGAASSGAAQWFRPDGAGLRLGGKPGEADQQPWSSQQNPACSARS